MNEKRKQPTLILGIDDAGRGPVIGPMILAGCLLDEKSEVLLKKAGVKDSKDITPRRREYLATMIKEEAITFEMVMASPEEIDAAVNNGSNLNVLEAKKMAEIINKVNKGFKRIKVVIDCPSVNITKWVDILKTYIENLSNLEVVAEHKADRNHVAVSAASIIAKSLREKEVAKLKEIYGDELGSGYASDPNTIKFIEKYVQKYADEGIFRHSWETMRVAKEKIAQTQLAFA